MNDHGTSQGQSPVVESAGGAPRAERPSGRRALLRRSLLAGLVIAAAVTLAAAQFVWKGAGSSPNVWNDCDNWAYTGSPSECYPSEGADEVLIPWNAGGWDVYLVDGEIGEMTVESSVDFIATTDPTTFSNAGLFLDAASGELTVTMTGAALLVDDD